MSYKDLIDDEGYKVKLIWVRPERLGYFPYKRVVALKKLDTFYRKSFKKIIRKFNITVRELMR